MPAYGIVAEFNPFHNGHKRIIDEARGIGASEIVIAMSGNSVQRGEISILDKYTRAEAAVKCGADLVVELPFPWCSASAEYFAKSGIYVLSNFCDNVIFGSECGDINLLTNAAQVVISEEFVAEYKDRLSGGEGSAKAYFSMLEERGFGGLSSNDLLGIEYIKAAQLLCVPIKFHTVKREGTAYNSNTLENVTCPSATALRTLWKQGKYECEQYIPSVALDVFKDAIEKGKIVDEDILSRIVLTYLRLAFDDDFLNVAEADGGLVNRIYALARSSNNTEELLKALKTKRYTDAKLRRTVLFCVAQVTTELLKSLPLYTTLLAADKFGRDILSKIRKKEKAIEIVTKPADTPTDNLQFKAQERIESIFAASLKCPTSLEDTYRKKAFICNL